MSETTNFAEKISEAVEKFGAKIEVPEGARDFVKRGVNAAKEQTENLHTANLKTADAVESALGKSLASFASFNRKLIEAAYEDGLAYLDAVEKFAGAKNLSDALRVPVEYVRERNEVNVGRIKTAFQQATDAAKEGAKTLQDAAGEAAKAAQDQVARLTKPAAEAEHAA